MSLGDRFSASRNVGTEGGGLVHPHSEDSKAVSGLGYRKTLIDTVWAVSPFLCMDGLRTVILPCGLHFYTEGFLRSGQRVVG